MSELARWTIKRDLGGVWHAFGPGGEDVSFDTWRSSIDYVRTRTSRGPGRRPPAHLRRQRLRPWKVLALVGLVTVVLLGGITASWAFWTDSSTVTGGTLTSGSMDMQLSANGTTWGAVGLGTAFDDSSVITASNITPSESYAFTLSLRNVGQADFTYTATVIQASPWTFVSTPITVRFYAGGTPSTDTTYPIQKTCSGGTALGSATTVTSSASSLLTTARRLNAGSSDPLCMEVAMATSADNGNQGQSGVLRFDFTATQVTS